MIRPWYRSRLFWLGLPGLAFLLWAWRDSSTFSSGLFRSGHLEVHCAKQYLGAVEFSYFPAHWETGPKRFDTCRTEYERVVDERFPMVGAYTFPEAVHAYHRPPSRFSERGIRIAHWLILTVYVLAWGGAVTGWQRRKSHLLKLHSASPP